MLKTEQITVNAGGEIRSFEVSNRRRLASGVAYMSEEEFSAHKAEQKAAMENTIQKSQEEAGREEQLEALRVKLVADTATLKDVRKLLRLERGLE